MFLKMVPESKFMLLYRTFCTKSNKKTIGEIIKNFNYENKKLFGAALKLKNLTKDKKKEHSNPTPVDGNLKKSEPDKSSEHYWLFNKHSEKKGVKLKFAAAQIEDTSENPKYLGEHDNLNSNKIKKEEPEKIYEQQIIPFKNIKEILKFPLILNTSYIETKINENNSFDGRLPSVGKILQSTLPEASRNALINWKLKIISELGMEKFISLQKDHLKKGKDLHTAIEKYLLHHQLPDLTLDMKKLWSSIEPALQSMQPIDVKLTEFKVNHPHLKYHGVVDCVSGIGNDIAIIEWKKSDKIKNNISSTFDAPLQLCAYLGALNTDPKFSSFNISKGLVVVAYTNGQPAEIHRLNKDDLQKYWNLWLKRVQEYWIRTRDNTLPEGI